MKRLETWHQDTPREQIGVLLQAAQGQLLNARKGIGSIEKQLEISLKALAQVQQILLEMPEGSWVDVEAGVEQKARKTGK